MLRRAIHIFCSFWLAMLLLFGGTAKEAIHAFAAHTDTEHKTDDGKRLSWESPHHHCTFLSFHLLPFDAPVSFVFYAGLRSAPYQLFTERLFVGMVPFFVPGSGLRGPPEC